MKGSKGTRVFGLFLVLLVILANSHSVTIKIISVIIFLGVLIAFYFRSIKNLLNKWF